MKTYLIDCSEAAEAAGFSDFVHARLLADRPAQIRGSHWDNLTRVLYMAIETEEHGTVAFFYQDRGIVTEQSARQQRITFGSEHEIGGLRYIHCPRSFLSHLSPTESPIAQRWRRDAGEWSDRMDVLIGATANAEPGDIVTLKPPGKIPGPRYGARVTATRAFEALPGVNWPNAHVACDLVGQGYVISIFQDPGVSPIPIDHG